MDDHEEYLELCAAAVANELSAEEEQKLKAHLATCHKCRAAMKDYETVLMKAIPSLAPEMVSAEDTENHGQPLGEAEKKLFQTINAESHVAMSCGESSRLASPTGKRYSYRPSEMGWREVWMTFAAAIILAAALAITLYKTGLRRGAETARIVPARSDGQVGSLEAQLSDAGYERQQLKDKLSENDRTIQDLRRRLEQQKITIQALQKINGGSQVSRTGEDNSVPTQSTDLMAAQAQLTQLKQALDGANKEREDATLQVAALEGKLNVLSKLVRDREQALNRKEEQVADQQELLDHDRDIRDLMGARELYMADVHDVDKTGTSKTYGRIFFTKGRSLIFYAFDLQEKARLQNASTYQVWGRMGPDKRNARSLGIFYEDNASKKRWVMKATDSKSLQDIDAVFVTVEPNGGSPHPSSNPLLFAYLGVNPNHP